MHAEQAGAAAEHQPLFRLSLRILDENGAPVFYKSDEGRGFGKENTIKVVASDEYSIEVELDDLGRTVSSISQVSIDGTVMSAIERRAAYNEQSENNIFVIIGNWTPPAASTKRGDREVMLISLEYQHGSTSMTMEFHLQMKIYDTAKQARGGYSKRLKSAVCRYDLAKGIERWSYLEDTEFDRQNKR
uniref:CB1 cannabinoid receptor-interacting protein 1 n=1 Tax=Calcidiscus leptoporus TaxID=127549 RepID=A0A7S0JAZ1_9EUKA|mmetsp:Transcript_48712/g.112725  ORF Transcript_48712/g.112725 Transcript_48712/m.112725 type:complete len:188 (+) Transcript_48712:149-712(+)